MTVMTNDAVTRTNTRDERIAKVKDALGIARIASLPTTIEVGDGPRVKATVVCNEAGAWLVEKGLVGELVGIDENDSALTFLVRYRAEDWNEHRPMGVREINDATFTVWQYDVEVVTDAAPEAPAEAEKETDPKVSLLERTLAEVRERVATLETDLTRMRERHARLDGEFDGFKETVRTVAIRVAEEQDWCKDGLNEVLEELGLEKVGPKRVRFIVQVEVEVEATVTGDNDPEDEEFISSSLTADSDGELRMDSDWTDESWLGAEIVGIKSVEAAQE